MTERANAPIPFQGQDPNVVVTRDAQTEMYATILNHMQGAFGTESQIDMVLPVGSGETIKAGSVCYIDPTTNTFKSGLAAHAPGYFAKPANGYSGVPKAGNVYGDGILTLPCLASYRLCTTEYVAGTYAANQELTVHKAAGANKGKLEAGQYYHDDIVAVVARGILADYDKPGRNLLEFFTYWLPEFDEYSHSYVGAAAHGAG